jgi:CHAT domain-containing protein
LEALEDALPNDHSALVEYWTGEKASYGWSITRSGIRGFRMPPASQLDRQCAAFRKALLATASRNPHLSAERRADLQPKLESRWRNLGAQLAETLFPSGMLSPSTSTVLIVGDGSIESVPFAALSILLPVRTPKTSPRNVTFLNEPSATILSFLEAQHSSPHTMRLAIFTAEQQSTKMQGAWIRHASQNEQRKQAVESSTLPFTGDESAMLRALFGASATRTFSGSSVSPKTLQDLDWSQFSIGHFAMHAALNERYAELNGLSPIGEQGPASAKLLWYGDVCHLHAKLDLVVLSACNTALGEQLQGEGLRGLTQAFFAAGSQRVLGTLWEVDDQATSEWMRHFYESLKQTRSPVTALQNAQARMAGDPQWSSPYYWAGFVLAGDWRPLP